MREARFEDLFQNAPCGYLTVNADRVITLVNDTLLALGGWERSEVEGKQLQDLLDVGSRMFMETNHFPVLRLRGELREVSLRMICADASVLPVLVNAVQRGDEVRFAIFDATIRGEYERELLEARRVAEHSEARVRALQDAATTFGSSTVEARLTEALAEAVRRAVSAMSSAVMLIDGPGPLVLVAGSNPLMANFPLDAPRPSATAFSTVRPVVISSVQEARGDYPEVAEAMLQHDVEAMIVTPLLAEDQPLGVVACFFGRERRFDESTVELQFALARQAAQTIARIRLQRQLEVLALHDPLTGLGNRALLHEQVSQAIAAASREREPIAVMFLDLDGFKAVNDELGHTAGDAVLQQVALRLRSAVRGSDAVGRYGGDEFVAICEGVDERSATEIADRIRDVVRLPFPDVPGRFPISASIGIAHYYPTDRTAPTPEALLDIADAAMYRAKHAGRDRAVLEIVEAL